MKLWIFCCLLVAVVARPPEYNYPGEVQILKYVSENNGVDGFNYEFEQSDGTKAEARGNIINVVEEGKEVAAVVIEGSYSFVNNGVTYLVRYVADQNGYHPTVSIGEPRVPGLPGHPGLPGQPGLSGEPGVFSAPGVSPLVYASLLGPG